ncbi:hypothetical protein EV421DRAFT_1842712 [Armillaria borealis]|uniref:Helitron helicase-like domain-containing protein n=1 Tax=Armillaria borealis TaxID=47425 RepID=A0AA39J3M5_9AGAR|nr:hypothetical protein EV421DRAFT_1842712 [Armillaria borealis]
MQDDFHIEISYSYTSSPSYLAQERLADLHHTFIVISLVPLTNLLRNVQTDSVADQFPLNQRSTSQERDQSRCSAAERQRARRQSRRENEDTVSTRPRHHQRGNPSNPGHWWDNVAVLNTSKVQRNTLKWTRTCKYCGIKVLTNERTHDDCFVCGPHGSHALPHLPPYPDEWQVFLAHRQLGASSRRLNSLFSLTALGVYDGDFMHFKSGVAAVTLNGGRTYHRLIPAQEGQHAIRWFLHEPGQRYVQGAEQSIPKNWIDAALAGLQRVNPFVKELQNLQTQDDEQMALHIEEPSSIVGSDVAAVISLSPNAPPSRRTIVIKRIGEDHHRFLDLLSPYVEPLHYVLFFPYGTLGWAPGRQLTQTRWHRTRFFMNAEQMSVFSKLMGEYLVDTWSSIEEAKLTYIRANQHQPDDNDEESNHRILISQYTESRSH